MSQDFWPCLEAGEEEDQRSISCLSLDLKMPLPHISIPVCIETDQEYPLVRH